MKIKKIFHLFAILFIILINCTGCNEFAKIEKQNTDTSMNVNISEEKTKNINDYYIENDIDQPLSICYLSCSDYEQMLDNIQSMWNMSSKHYEISYLEQWCDNISFRRIDSKDKVYYCVLGNKDTNEKAYLFFDELNGYDICRCFNCITVNGDNITEKNPDGTGFYQYIADIDK